MGPQTSDGNPVHVEIIQGLYDFQTWLGQLKLTARGIAIKTDRYADK
jgi:hypothetical protein